MPRILACQIYFFFVLIATTKCFPHNKNENAKAEQRRFTFDDLYDSKFSYKTFYPNWVSDSEYLTREDDGIQRVNFESGNSTIIVSDSVYGKTNAQSWSLSADEKYFFVRTSYTKQWRHSYNGSYSVYSVDNGDDDLMTLGPNIQYMRWSPTNNSLVWVEENDLYYAETPESDIKRLTLDGRQNAIYNGVPDWVYEEEMVSSRHVIYWSPDGRFLAFLSTNDTNVEQIEFSTYKGSKYPEMVQIAYPKAGTPNPVVKLRVRDLSQEEEEFVVQAPVSMIGEDHLFSTFHWYPDSRAFLVSWLNRISNHTVPQLCQQDTSETWTCDVVQAGVEESSTGWIGNGGTPFTPRFIPESDSRAYISAFSNDEGFWHAAFVDPTETERRFLTTGGSVVTSIVVFDATHDWVYFIAAAPTAGNRHLFRVHLTSENPSGVENWDCLSCDIDSYRCLYVSPSFSPQLSWLFLNCGGPDVPMTTVQFLLSNGNYSEPMVYENNTDLIENKNQILWPNRLSGIYDSSATKIKFNYEMYYPANFDQNKKYPLLIEVYGGPGFQKVRHRWTRRWAQTHLVSQYDILVASFDGRGSGYRGDGIAHMLYKKLGQLEKEDTTEFAEFLAENPYVDRDNIAVWGWSYGGYTTTFTLSLGREVFKCGIAVAPLASRYFYDTIHTERYMTLPKDNEDGYEKCSILNANLTNLSKASYTIIHGTADDNVHFQNAALINKALIEADVDFESVFYSDEAHSINTGKNANKHIYRYLTKKVRQCFGLSVPEM